MISLSDRNPYEVHAELVARIERLEAEMYPADAYRAVVAETHKLQANLAQARAETDDLVSKAWDAAKAGFDELRAENARLKQTDAARYELFTARNAEITRLEGLVESRDAEIVRLGNAWDECLAEVERLRAALHQILIDPDACILASHRDDGWEALARPKE